MYLGTIQFHPRSITKHKQTIAQVFGNMLKTEIPVWGELSSLVLDQIVTSHIAQYLRDSGLNPKSSKNPLYESQSNVPKKALISTPCPEEAKFGISDLVVHDLNWKIQNNLLNYSIRVDFIKQMVGDALQHRMLNYSTAWCQQKLEYKMESISKYLSYEPAPRDIYYSYDGPSITDEE